MLNIYKFTVVFSSNCNKMLYYSTLASWMSISLTPEQIMLISSLCLSHWLLLIISSRAIQTIQIPGVFQTDMVSKAFYYLFINSIEF